MRSFAALSLLLTLANAQTINPNTVSLATRQQWCVAQKEQCPIICASVVPDGSTTTTSDTCDATTLDWSCVCSNGITPNITEYSQTIPYFECTEFNNQCVSNCGQDNICAGNCRSDHPCGAQSPKLYNTTSTTSTASKTASATGSGSAAASSSGSAIFGGAGGSSGSSGSSSGKSSAAVAAINLGQTYGLAVVVSGLFAGFTLLL